MNADEFEYKFFKGATADEDRVRFLVAGIIAVFVLVLGCVSIAILPDPNVALKVLEEAGFSGGKVEESGVWTLRCSDDDYVYYRVIAKNPKGEPTEATVCCGIFKDCTIRF